MAGVNSETVTRDRGTCIELMNELMLTKEGERPVEIMTELKEILVYKQSSLLHEFVPELLQLRVYPSNVLKRELAGLLEEISKMPSGEGTVFFSDIFTCLHDLISDLDVQPMVSKRVITAGTLIFRKTFAVVTEGASRVPPTQQSAIWSAANTFKSKVVSLASSSGGVVNDGVKLHAFKFLESTVHLFLGYLDKKGGAGCSAGDNTPPLPGLSRGALQREAKDLIKGLVSPLSPPSAALQLAGPVLIVLVNSLANLAATWTRQGVAELALPSLIKLAQEAKEVLSDTSPSAQAMNGKVNSVARALRDAFVRAIKQGGHLLTQGPQPSSTGNSTKATTAWREPLSSVLNLLGASAASDQALRHVDRAAARAEKEERASKRARREQLQDNNSQQQVRSVGNEGDPDMKPDVKPEVKPNVTAPKPQPAAGTAAPAPTAGGAGSSAKTSEATLKKIMLVLDEFISKNQKELLNQFVANLHEGLLADLVIAALQHLPPSYEAAQEYMRRTATPGGAVPAAAATSGSVPVDPRTAGTLPSDPRFQAHQRPSSSASFNPNASSTSGPPQPPLPADPRAPPPPAKTQNLRLLSSLKRDQQPPPQPQPQPQSQPQPQPSDPRFDSNPAAEIQSTSIPESKPSVGIETVADPRVGTEPAVDPRVGVEPAVADPRVGVEPAVADPRVGVKAEETKEGVSGQDGGAPASTGSFDDLPEFGMEEEEEKISGDLEDPRRSPKISNGVKKEEAGSEGPQLPPHHQGGDVKIESGLADMDADDDDDFLDLPQEPLPLPEPEVAEAASSQPPPPSSSTAPSTPPPSTTTIVAASTTTTITTTTTAAPPSSSSSGSLTMLAPVLALSERVRMRHLALQRVIGAQEQVKPFGGAAIRGSLLVKLAEGTAPSSEELLTITSSSSSSASQPEFPDALLHHIIQHFDDSTSKSGGDASGHVSGQGIAIQWLYQLFTHEGLDSRLQAHHRHDTQQQSLTHSSARTQQALAQPNDDVDMDTTTGATQQAIEAGEAKDVTDAMEGVTTTTTTTTTMDADTDTSLMAVASSSAVPSPSSSSAALVVPSPAVPGGGVAVKGVGVPPGPLYSRLLRALVLGLLSSRPYSDRVLPRLLVEVPAITDEVLHIVMQLCYGRHPGSQVTARSVKETISTLGLATMWDLIIQRPTVRPHCLGTVLRCTVSPREQLRGKAIRLTANKLFPHPALQDQILGFAQRALDRSMPDLNMERQEAATALPQVEQTQMTAVQQHKDANGHLQLAPSGVRENNNNLHAASHPAATAELDEFDDVMEDDEEEEEERGGDGDEEGAEERKAARRSERLKDPSRFVALFFALCTKKHSLLEQLLVAYGKCASSPALLEVFHALLPGLVRTIGSSSPHLTALVEAPPQGSLEFILRTLGVLTGTSGGAGDVAGGVAGLDPMLVAAVRDLYQKTDEVKVIVHVVGALPKSEVMSLLPKLVSLLDKDTLRGAISGILKGIGGPGGRPALQPAELLLTLHTLEDKKVPLKKVIDAVGQCFILKSIFKPDVLAVVLNQLMELSPLPTLLMRTIIQTVSFAPKLKPRVIETLATLVNKQVWSHPRLWEGFVKCMAITAPDSYPVLLRLPVAHLEHVLRKEQKLRQPLASYATKPEVKATTARATLIALGLVTDDTKSVQEKTEGTVPKDRFHIGNVETPTDTMKLKVAARTIPKTIPTTEEDDDDDFEIDL